MYRKLLPILVLVSALSIIAPPPHALAQDSLGPPSNLSYSMVSNGIAISWTAPAGQVDGYEILRRRPTQGETELMTLVANTGSSATSYTDSSATTPGEHYIYRVVAIRGDQKSPWSQRLDVDLSIPPTNLSYSVSAKGITLNWTAPPLQLDGYEILRRRPLRGENLSTLVANTGSTATTYTDVSATTPGERYIYRVKAIYGSLKSKVSKPVTVDLPLPTDTPVPPTVTPTPIPSTDTPVPPTYTPTPIPPTDTPIPPTDTPTPTPEPKDLPAPGNLRHISGTEVAWDSVVGAISYRVGVRQGGGKWKKEFANQTQFTFAPAGSSGSYEIQVWALGDGVNYEWEGERATLTVALATDTPVPPTATDTPVPPTTKPTKKPTKTPRPPDPPRDTPVPEVTCSQKPGTEEWTSHWITQECRGGVLWQVEWERTLRRMLCTDGREYNQRVGSDRRTLQFPTGGNC
jgi:hypothetical protein